jgi:hypothetical protein
MFWVAGYQGGAHENYLFHTASVIILRRLHCMGAAAEANLECPLNW